MDDELIELVQASIASLKASDPEGYVAIEFVGGWNEQESGALREVWDMGQWLDHIADSAPELLYGNGIPISDELAATLAMMMIEPGAKTLARLIQRKWAAVAGNELDGEA